MDVTILGVAQGGDFVSFLMPLVIIFGIFYFLVIRPQNKQRREREQMLSRLKKGDRIVTNGGLLGTVSGIREGVVTLLVSDKVRVRVLQSQIAGSEDEFVKKAAEASSASTASTASNKDSSDEDEDDDAKK